MRTLLTVAGVAVISCLLPSAAPPSAAPLDSSTPILCALNSVTECARRGNCERTNSEDAEIPSFVQINVPKKVLSTVDGKRTSPITSVNRANGRLMIQGMQNERVWGAVVDEETGHMSATVSEADGAIVITGACTAP
jgi:hypothetical protein